jgi:hypothetical protein
VLRPENLGTLPCEVQPGLLFLRCVCPRCASLCASASSDLMIYGED